MCSTLFVTLNRGMMLLEASFRHHRVDYSRGLISVIALQPVVELFDPFHLLDSNKETQLVQCHDCHVGVVDGRQLLIVFGSLHHSSYMALQSMSDKIFISYISREDE